MYTLLKPVKGQAERFVWNANGKPEQYRVVFEPRYADHFADNKHRNDHLPNAISVASVLCSGFCVIRPSRKQIPNEYEAFGVSEKHLYMIPGTFDGARRIFMPKTGFLCNPNRLSIHDYRGILTQLNTPHRG
jgi:hypothetical protein